jgi:hypothetical protein
MEWNYNGVGRTYKFEIFIFIFSYNKNVSLRSAVSVYWGCLKIFPCNNKDATGTFANFKIETYTKNTYKAIKILGNCCTSATR